MSALFEIRDLKKHFPSKGGGIFNRDKSAVKAVDGVSFNIEEGETLGIVGESGCGKTTLGRTLIRLVEPTAGHLIFKGEDITHYSSKQMRKLRSQMQIIFQDPYSALNPRHTIGRIISAPFEIQGVEPEGGVKREVQRLMERVGLNPEHFNRYPHEFSGGQRQRIGIARALYKNADIIFFDEATSALDPITEENLIESMRLWDKELTLLMITHRHKTLKNCNKVYRLSNKKIQSVAQSEL